MARFNHMDFLMEQFFDLHQMLTQQKVTIASLYLEPDQFVWYQWICDYKNDSIISWSIFKEELIAHYGDVNRNTFFSQLVNLKQKGSVTDHIKQFQQVSLIVKNILEDNLLDLFIRTLKDNIQHQVHLFEPSSLEKDFMMARKVENKNMAMTTEKAFSNTYRENTVPSSKPPQRLTPQ